MWSVKWVPKPGEERIAARSSALRGEGLRTSENGIPES
jgi:hypothetical protein